jgi:hypothetical protein
MPTPTYTLIDSTTLSVATDEVDFLTITQGFRDLVLVINGTVSSNSYIGAQFNSDDGSHYSGVRMYGDGSNDYSSTLSPNYAWFNDFFTNPSTTIAQVIDYSASDKHKTVLVGQGSAGNVAGAVASRWANNAPITSMKIVCEAGKTFSIGTTLNLYGIAG